MRNRRQKIQNSIYVQGKIWNGIGYLGGGLKPAVALQRQIIANINKNRLCFIHSKRIVLLGFSHAASMKGTAKCIKSPNNIREKTHQGRNHTSPLFQWAGGSH